MIQPRNATARGRHCAICGKPGGSGMREALRLLGYDVSQRMHAHGPCVGAAQKKQAAKQQAAAATPGEITVTVPPAFHTDRAERALPVGTVLKTTSKGVTIRIPVKDARDYLDDAAHYADADGPDQCAAGLKASARAAVARLRAALS